MAKHDLMRNENLFSVFQAVSRHGPVTKKEIKAHTGLSWGSISGITAELLERELLVTSDGSTVQVGRMPVGLTVNPHKHLVAGIDINLRGITAAIIDLAGRIHGEEITEPVELVARETLLAQVKGVLGRLRDSLPDPGQLRAIGVSFPGHVDRVRGVSVRTRHFQGFDDYPICRDLSEAFGLPVHIDNDTNCIANAEYYGGVVQGEENFILIRFSRGIGMSIFPGQEAFYSRGGSNGEIGHMVLDPNGPQCRCGNHGCLETYASVWALEKQFREGIRLGLCCPATTREDEKYTLADVMREAERGESYSHMLLQRAAAYTGIAITNAVNLLDPRIVVLCGDLANYPLYTHLVEKAAQSKPYIFQREIQIRIAQRDDLSAAIGAGCFLTRSVFLERMQE